MQCKRDSFSHLIKSHFTIIQCDLRTELSMCVHFIWRECADTLRDAEGELKAVKNQLIAAHTSIYRRAIVCDYDKKLLSESRFQSAKFSLVKLMIMMRMRGRTGLKKLLHWALCNYQSFIIEQLSTASNSINFCFDVCFFWNQLNIDKIWGRKMS